MSPRIHEPMSESAQETIRLLQQELAETNREVLALTVELEKRVEERTTALRAAQVDLQRANTELMDLALELEQRVAQRTAELARANEALRQQIAERLQAEQQVRRLNDELERRVQERTAQLEAANKELEAFSYSVSHDLRAPLRHLGGYAQALLEDYQSVLDDQGREYLTHLTAAAARMDALIENLLRFARMAREPLQASDINLDQLVRSVIADLESEQPPRPLVWQVQLLPRVRADPAMLRQVWINLIGNALKYTRRKETARIEIGWREGSDREWVFFVKDNGAGFDMKDREKLFGIFQRLHSQDEFEGTGIGLAIVRRIIERHGGRTWAEGEPGAGATFYFSLPKPG